MIDLEKASCEVEAWAGAGAVVGATNRSPAIGKIAKALAAAQGEIKAASKDRENTFFRSNYADLAAVWEACRAALSKHGIAVIQSPHPPQRVEPGMYEARAVVETVLAHESDEWFSSLISLPVFGRELKGGGRGEVDAQSFGSAYSYGRRYALAAMVGVYQDDDDGEAAVGPAEPSMSEEVLAGHLKAIAEALDEDGLRKAYIPAYKAAGRDQVTAAKLLQAKDAKKRLLEDAAKKAAAAAPPVDAK